MTEFVKIEGLKNVEKLLIDLGPVSGFKALRSGLMKVSKPMFDAARANARGTGLRGHDSDAMAAAMSRGTRKLTANITQLWIGPRNKNAKALAIYNDFHHTKYKRLNYFHLVEWGSVNGPAQPFMRPAFAAHSRSAVDNLGKEIRNAVEKIKRKHASR
jgi:HK97 gp10 family phage protein